VSFSRHFQSLVVHVERDEKIQAVLREALDGFLARFDEAVASFKVQKEAEDALLKAAYEAREAAGV